VNENYGAFKDDQDSDIDDFENLEKGAAIQSMIQLDDDDDEEEDENGDPVEKKVAPAPGEEQEGQCWLAVKPFIGALVAPSDAPANNPAAPDANLEVDWVYGYRGHDCRDNLFFDSKSRAVYPIASFVIAYDKKAHTQQVLRHHTDDVVSLCQHPTNKDIFASGQVQTISLSGYTKRPFICVFNLATQEMTKLPAVHHRAVRALTFSPDGKYLASVGADNNNSIYIWDWESKTKLAETKGDVNKIYCIEWSSKTKGQLVTVGVKHVFIWTWTGGSIKRNRGLSGKVGIQTYFCHRFMDNGNVLLGSKKGQLVMYDAMTRTPKVVAKPHKGAVFALVKVKGGYITGGKDKFLRFFDNSFKEKWSLEFGSYVRSVNSDGTNIVVGTRNGEIYFVPESGASTVPEAVIAGHFEGEVWGLHVLHNTFLTSGEDNMVINWDMTAHKPLAYGKVSNLKKVPKTRRKYGVSTTSRFHPCKCARAVSMSPDGTHIALGRNDGKLAVLDAKSLKVMKVVNLNKISKRQIRNQKGNWIEAMSYSPCGKFLAVGTHGMVVCICEVAKDYECAVDFKSHNSVITHLDWSADSQHIRSTDKGYELLFFDVDAKDLKKSKHNPHATALKDLEWATNSCVLSWPTQCVWDTDMDGSDVNAVDVFNKQLVATGDDHGNVNLFRYPVLESSNEQIRHAGHSSHVTNVKFSKDGKYLISVGGGDKAVVQWRLKA